MNAVSKLDLAVIVGVIAGATLWIEHGHRVNIERPTDAALVAPVGAICPDNDSVPYGPSCLAFLGDDASNRARRANTAAGPAALVSYDPSRSAEVGPFAAARACPDNDNRPYTPSCVRFLSGWFWHAN
jgi:hypothetical protein